jgi:hypothetical protein
MFNNTTLSNIHLDLNLIKVIFRVVVEPNFFFIKFDFFIQINFFSIFILF